MVQDYRLVNKIQERKLGDYRRDARSVGAVRAEPELGCLPWLVPADCPTRLSASRGQSAHSLLFTLVPGTSH